MRIRLVVMVVALAALSLPGGASAIAPKMQFSSTGHEQSYVVPSGVVLLGIGVEGGHGGGGFGGRDGGVGALLPVTPGQTLFAEVGATGVYGGGVVFGGGGAAGAPPPVLAMCTGSPCNDVLASSGGGASDVRTCSILTTSCPGGVSSVSTRLIVGGGGGGSRGSGNSPGNICGGLGSGAAANNFQYPPGNPGGGPVPIITAAGIVYPGRSTGEVPAYYPGVTPAGGGSSVAGAGGLEGGCSSGAATVSDSVAGSTAVGGVGGTGGNASSLGPMFSGCSMSVGNCYDAGPGGGGGGGYFGGGGGGTGLDRETGPTPPCPCNNASAGQGGGAGSSFVSNRMTDPVNMSLVMSPGTVVMVPVIEIDTPANGAVYAPGQVVHASWSCGFDSQTALGIGSGCSGSVANGSPINTSPGTHTFTVSGTVSSNGPHPISANVTYTVKSGGGSGPGIKQLKAKIQSAQRTATFTFKATSATGFQCALVKKTNHHKSPKFSLCHSPKTYKHLKNGKYLFDVRAIGAGGPGPPKSRSFTIT